VILSAPIENASGKPVGDLCVIGPSPVPVLGRHNNSTRLRSLALSARHFDPGTMVWASVCASASVMRPLMARSGPVMVLRMIGERYQPAIYQNGQWPTGIHCAPGME
jgi:hypothetical protein